MIKKIVLFLIVNIFFLPTYSGADANIDDIKVAYIYNFVRYVKWPEVSVKKDTFNLCVDENSHLENKLLLLEKRSVKNKPIKVISISGVDEKLSQCEMLVLPKMGQEELRSYTEYAALSSILTVSDVEDYAKRNVMINLVEYNNQIKLEINLNKVKASNLTISSSLLKLATIVESED